MRIIFRYYGRVARIFLTEPAFRGLLLAALATLAVGSVFYHYVEGWGWLDAIYFCTVTLASIGYGDLTPTTNAAKAFTILYAIFGLGIIAAFITAVARAPFLLEGGNTGVNPQQSLFSQAAQPPSPPPEKTDGEEAT